jgi:hypothetical protein
MQSEFRAYIRHISVLDKSKFSDALLLATDFIWQNLYADTIRVDLHHFRPENDPAGNPGTDNEIKTALGMAKKGFKWKTLINDPTGKRYQIMQMSKPKELEVSDAILKERKMKSKQEPLTMKSAMILRLYSDVYQDVKTPGASS